MTGGRKRRIVFGSRTSRLAMWQTQAVASALRSAWNELDLEVEIIGISTRGDQIIDKPLPEIGGKGLFTAELDQAILTGVIDIAVHSLKDLPVEPGDGIAIVTVMERADPRDVLITKHATDLANLPPAPVIGTSSLRRSAQILALRPDALIRSIRGNVPTRIAKAAGEYDGVVIAAAGVNRLQMDDSIATWFGLNEVLPAPGQGFIGATIRANDSEMRELLAAIENESARRCSEAERALLAALGGGCSTPVASLALITPDGRMVHLRGRVVSPDGKIVIDREASGTDGIRVAQALAADLLEHGAGEILAHKVVLSSVASRPLLGKRVLVTRAADQSDITCSRLRDAGADPVDVPLIACSPMETMESAATMVQRLEDFDWVLFTSVNAINFFFQLVRDGKLPDRLKIACVGNKTAKRLEAIGRKADFVPTAFSSQQLAEEMPIKRGETILYPSAEVISSDLPASLEVKGAVVHRWPIYRTDSTRESGRLREALQEGVHAVTFASPSAVDSFCENVADYHDILGKSVVAVIGPMTLRRASERGIRVDVIPEQYDIESMIAALEEYFGSTGNSRTNYA